MTIDVTGVREAQRALQRLLRDIEHVAPEAIKDVAFDLLGKAVNLAPIDTADLRGSGKVELETNGDKITATVSFNTPYAVRQHEDLTYNHPRGGEAKYLEKPFVANTPRYIQHIRDSVRRATDNASN